MRKENTYLSLDTHTHTYSQVSCEQAIIIRQDLLVTDSVSSLYQAIKPNLQFYFFNLLIIF